MCTAVRFTDKDGNLYFGRNLDWGCGYGQQVIITPRQYQWQSKHLGPQTTKSAIIGMAVPMNGMAMYFDCANEDGLAIAGLSFAAGFCAYKPAEEGKTNVTSYEMPLWVTTNFTTVDEVEAAVADLLITDDQSAPQFPPTPLHWIVADKDRSIVIEQTAEGLKVHHDGFDVLTNQPTFDWHVNNMRNYIAMTNKWPGEVTFGTEKLTPLGTGASIVGLPGDTSSISRFVRVAYINANYPVQEGDEANMARLFRTLGNVAMVKGMSYMGDGDFEYTLYTGGYDGATKSYFYNTYDGVAPVVVTIDEDKATAKDLVVID